MLYDIIAEDGAVLYRLEGKPVAVAGETIPDRIEDALNEEFEDQEITTRPREPPYEERGAVPHGQETDR